jgi:hypothetical protein
MGYWFFSLNMVGLFFVFAVDIIRKRHAFAGK